MKKEIITTGLTTYYRIDIRQAKKLFNVGCSLVVVPYDMHLLSPWYSEIFVNNLKWCDWEKFLNEFNYYYPNKHNPKFYVSKYYMEKYWNA